MFVSKLVRTKTEVNEITSCAVPFCCPIREIALLTLMMRRPVLLSHCGVIISFIFGGRIRQMFPLIGTREKTGARVASCKFEKFRAATFC